MTDESKRIFTGKLLQNTAEALRKNGFDAETYDSAEAAGKLILGLIGSGKKVGLGGSMSMHELDLPSAIKRQGNEIITHKPDMGERERRTTWLKAQAADFYLASPQAITANGELIFVDGFGNRAAAVIYGPGTVILAAGVNKVVRDIDEGLWRARNVAAVANNIRLKKSNPCVKTGKCEDCSSPERICNAVTLLWKKPRLTDYKIVLVNESLGY